MPTPAIGAFLPTMSAPGDEPGDIAASARHAEDLGLESVWTVDQLVAGTGAPFIESVVALAAAAGATSRVRLGFGVVILPLRPVVWVAKQVASLQHVSGGRVILGVGAGGDRPDRPWVASGVPRRGRGPRTRPPPRGGEGRGAVGRDGRSPEPANAAGHRRHAHGADRRSGAARPRRPG